MQEISPSIFKAYDIRGEYPAEFNVSVAKEIVKGLSLSVFNKKGPIVIAHDARNSSESIYKGIIKELGGREIIKIGPATTPMFYFFVTERKAVGGIMITASHNPPNWNGFKIVGVKAGPINGFDVKQALKKNE